MNDSPVKVVIAEDDRLTARALQHFCRDAFRPQPVQFSLFEQATPALCYVQENAIDLLILDINLKGESGFEILRQPEKNGFYTIIVSSDTRSAVEAFNHGVVDFVAKPFSRERFFTAVARMKQAAQNGGGFQKNSLPIKTDGQIQLLRFRDILYLEADGNFTDIHLKGGEVERVRRTLDSLMEELNSDFFRSHRSCIVNLAEISRIVRGKNNTYTVIMDDSHEVPCSRSRYNVLRKILM